MYVLVKNLSGTGSERYSDPHGYSSWKEFWKAKKAIGRLFVLPETAANQQRWVLM